jgi:hypothetical protein
MKQVGACVRTSPVINSTLPPHSPLLADLIVFVAILLVVVVIVVDGDVHQREQSTLMTSEYAKTFASVHIPTARSSVVRGCNENANIICKYTTL